MDLKTSGIDSLIKTLQNISNGLKGVESLNDRELVNNGKVVVDGLKIDENRLSETEEEAKKEWEYKNKIKNNSISKEDLDAIKRLSRDVIRQESNGVF